MIRLILFLAIMLLAAVLDIKDRRIPDWIHLLLVGVSFIPPEPVHIMGVFAALPLFIAGITTGGVGGGDIKLIGACGLVLGASRTLTGLFLGLCFLLIYHGIVQSVRRIRKLNKEEVKEQAYPLVPFLLMGMFFDIGIGGLT